MPPERIAFLGIFGSGNLGNDASLEAMLQFVRRARPDAKLTCVCPQPAEVRQVYGIDAVRMSWPGFATPWFRVLNTLLFRLPTRIVNLIRAVIHARRFDLIIIPGTGIFDDFGEGPWGVPLGLFRWCLACQLTRKPLALVSIGAGPIHHPVSRWFMLKSAAIARYRSYRDALSRNYMKSVGFDSQADPIYPDLAFGLHAPQAAKARDGAPPGDTLTVGLGIMTYYGWRNDTEKGAALFDAYLLKLQAFLTELLQRGYRVRLLLGDRVDQLALTTLMQRVQTAMPGLAADRLSAPEAASLGELMSIIAETDVVVATRFHNIVGALSMGKPVISIGYAQKNDVLLGQMGLSEFCQSIERLDVDLLRRQFDRLIAEREHHARAIWAKTDELRRQLGAQEAVITELLLGRPGGTPAQAPAPHASAEPCV